MDSPSLPPGTHLAHYRILRRLGAGGMGEVYEAEDTKLKRRVAVKVLPAGVTSDAFSRARLDKEAQAIAALNHPNIVTIYSVEESGDTRFLTMEIVDGRTLVGLIPTTGLPLHDLLKYAIPIADAVAAAHARQIVHRDLKPGNVMVTSDGRVKVLDFGLAKVLNPPPLNDAEATVTAAPATMAGQIVGTAAYMSPEQAEGRAVDQRSDMFSLGVVLYEMATGQRPFKGESGISILSAIIKDQPVPMTRLSTAVPRDLERLVDQCLAKDPERRLSSAEELRTRLEALGVAPPSRDRRVAAGLVLASAMVAIAVLAAFFMSSRTAPVPSPTFGRFTDDNGIEAWPSFSPDGGEIVYARRAGGSSGIYARAINGGASVQLTTDATDTMPVFSPDGATIAFSSLRDNSPGIFVMNRRGESLRRLTNGGWNPGWTPNGREIVYSTDSGSDPDVRQVPSELWAVDVASSQRRRIIEADAVQPRVSPDGRLVAFWGLAVDSGGKEITGADRNIWIQPVMGGERIAVASGESTDWNPAWAPDGRTLYFSSDRSGTMNIWQIAVDPMTGRPLGEPIALSAPTGYAGHMSVAPDGTIAYAAHDFGTLVRSIGFDPDTGVVTGEPRDIVTGKRSWLHPDVSLDGRFLALRSIKAQEDLWIVAVDGSGLRAVTNDPPRDRGPRWAADGSLLFYSARTGSFHVWTIQPDGSGARQLTSGLSIHDPVPSRDGRRVGGSNPNTGEQFIFDARDWTKPPERLPSPPSKYPVYLRDWSPDGLRLAAADTSNVVWVFDITAKTWDRIGPGSWPRWLPDGRRLLAMARARVTLIELATRTVRDVYQEPGRQIGTADLSPDGRTLYFTSFSSEADIWTIRFKR